MDTLKPTISIEYCPKCNWMLRAAYMAQEILSTFTEDVHGILLIPCQFAGKYTISIDQHPIFDRKDMGRFPEVKELKQLIRDHINPDKDLGHSEKK
jgi:selenoprotein W-related protein